MLIYYAHSKLIYNTEKEKEDLPFDKDSINDMFDLVEDKMAELETQLTYDNMNEDVPS